MFNVGLLGGPINNRPNAIKHRAIAPPFDPNDEYGEVHITLPPEQIIPPHFTDSLFLRADFNGVTLDLNRWSAQSLPFLKGANSTPLAMLMTPMLPLYPKYWQDACLTEHAERGYDDFVIAPEVWNAQENNQSFSIQQIIDWCKYVKSWGFRTVIWRGDPIPTPDTMLKSLCDAGVVDFYINGEEVDSKMTSEQFDSSLQNLDSYLGGKIPIGVHFTADGDRHMGYPIGFPRDTFLTSWAPYDGRVHLMQQLDVDASAGLQGASMYYARLRVNCGAGDGAGPGAPNSRVIAFEIMATAQLYGRCTEEYGCLRSWELLCGTRDQSCARSVSGSCNGIRYPNGDSL
jgi:hypothetical protein